MKAFANYHPAVLLLYFLSVLLVGMFVTNPVLQLTMLLGAVLFCLMLPHRSGGAGFYVPMFLLVAVTNPLFSHNGVTPLFYLNGVRLRRRHRRDGRRRDAVVRLLQRGDDER